MTKRTRSSSTSVAVFIIPVVVLVIYCLCFVVYANTVIARPYPTHHTNFFWGWLHGMFILPSFVVSLFNPDVAVYQTGNDGGWYDFGYLIGVGALFKGSRSSKRD